MVATLCDLVRGPADDVIDNKHPLSGIEWDERLKNVWFPLPFPEICCYCPDIPSSFRTFTFEAVRL
jgi:hypothetical protein